MELKPLSLQLEVNILSANFGTTFRTQQWRLDLYISVQ